MMMKFFYFSVFMLLFALPALTAQTTYTTSFDNDEGWEQYFLGAEMSGFYYWEIHNGVLRHGYPVGGQEYVDDWMVSPKFDFSGGAMIDSLTYKFGGFGLPQAGDTIALYMITGSQNPDEATSKTLLRLYTGEDYMNDNMARYDTNIEIPTTTEDAYLAFKYRTVVNWLDATFDDLKISGLVATQDAQLDKAITVFPNPSSDHIYIGVENGYNLYNIALINNKGEKVIETLMTEIDVTHLPKGVYYLRMQTDKGVSSQKIVLQ